MRAVMRAVKRLVTCLSSTDRYRSRECRPARTLQDILSLYVTIAPISRFYIESRR